MYIYYFSFKKIKLIISINLFCLYNVLGIVLGNVKVEIFKNFNMEKRL